MVWKPDWRVNLLALLILPILLWLGLWQLDRAEQKKALQTLYTQRQQATPVTITDLVLDQDLSYQPVTLTGHYQAGQHILIDNQIRDRRFGYDVITAFKLLDTDQWVWVNRGWLAADPTRLTLPEIEDIAGLVTLQGNIYAPRGQLWPLGQPLNDSWPRVVQRIDIPSLAKELDIAMFPLTVRLANHQPGALQTRWIVINVQPAKHIAYAVQWFSMAGVLLIIAVIANIRT